MTTGKTIALTRRTFVLRKEGELGMHNCAKRYRDGRQTEGKCVNNKREEMKKKEKMKVETNLYVSL